VIFGRDVEPILTHSLSGPSFDGSLPIQSAAPVDQLRVPPQKALKAIEQKESSVLDWAGAMLATTDGHDFIGDQAVVISPTAPSIAIILLATTSSSRSKSRSQSPAVSFRLFASMFGANKAGSVS
jgi:hypothetical protein